MKEDKHLKYVKATLALEGLELTSEEEALVLKRHRGEISQDEFLKQALELAKDE